MTPSFVTIGLVNPVVPKPVLFLSPSIIFIANSFISGASALENISDPESAYTTVSLTPTSLIILAAGNTLPL